MFPLLANCLDRAEGGCDATCSELLDIRCETAENPFGTIKQWMGQGAFLMRRLENVRGEFSLAALAFNIRRAITWLAFPV